MNPILVANTISKDLKKDYSELINDHNLTWVFSPFREINLSIEDFNILVSIHFNGHAI